MAPVWSKLVTRKRVSGPPTGRSGAEGDDNPALTTGDILGPSEAFRRQMDYFAHGRDQDRQFERLAALNPRTLACMQSSAWEGDAAALLRAQARALHDRPRLAATV